MAIKYGNSIDLDGFELQNFVVHNSAIDPLIVKGGAMYWNTTDENLKVYDTDGAGWFKLVQTDGISTDNAVALWDDITGKRIKDSGIVINSTVPLDGSSTSLPVSSIIKDYIDTAILTTNIDPILGISESGTNIFLDFNTLPSETTMVAADQLVFRKDTTGIHYTITLDDITTLITSGIGSSNAFKFLVLAADSGYTWGVNAIIASSDDTLDFVSGTGITIESDTTSKALRFSADLYLEDLSDVDSTAPTLSGQFPSWNATTSIFDFSKNINDYALTSHAHTNILLLKSSAEDTGEYVDMGDTLTIQSGTPNVMVGRTGSTFEISASFSGLTEIYGGAGIEVTGSGTSRTVAARIGSNMMWVVDGMNLAIDVDPSKVALQTDLHSPVTIGITNSGLYLTGQVLELALVTTTTDGAMSYLDKLRLDSALVTGSNLFTLKGGSADVGEVIAQGETITFSGGANVMIGRSGNEITISASFSGLTEIYEGAGIEVTSTGTTRTVAARIGSNMAWVVDGSNLAIDVDTTKIAMQTDLHDEVTIGVNANGLSILDQVLELALVTTTTNGAMSYTDKLKLDDALVTGSALFTLIGGTADTGEIINQGETVTFSGGSNVMVGRSGNEITISASFSGLTDLTEGAGIEITGAGTTRTIAARIGSNMTWVADGDNFAIDIDTTKVALQTDLHDEVTLGTANGLSISNQVLSLATATTALAGAMSATDKTFLNSLTTRLFILKGGSTDTGTDITQGETITISGDATILVGRSGNEITLSASYGGITTLTEGAGIEITGNGSSRTIAARIGSNMAWVVDGTNFAIDINTTTVALKSDLHSAVTIGTANGLSLDGQQLSLALATAGNSGAMSAAMYSKLDGLPSSADNYNHWKLADSTYGTYDEITTGETVTFLGTGSATVTRSGSTITVDVTAASETDPVFVASAAYGITSTDISNWNTAHGWGNHASEGYYVGTSTTIRGLFSETVTGLTYTASTGVLSLTAGYVIPTTTEQSNWNTAYNWGDHSTMGYLTTITIPEESDPIFVASPSYNITSTNISNWNAAYNWGNHANVGYLTSYTETDPIFTASAAYGITSTNITNWNEAYSWGDHSTMGYLTTLTIPTESDPVFTASAAYGITNTNISNWNAAYGWGNHANAGYLTSYTETDPVFTASDAYGITSSNITNWNTAYSWGNHASAGYLTSLTIPEETDPVFTASSAYGITNTNITNWNTAYNWGNHSTAGYLTSYTETDPLFTAHIASSIVSQDVTNWNTAYGWGDHSTQGYLTTVTFPNETDPVFVASAAYGITSTNISNWNTAYTNTHGAVTLGTASGLSLTGQELSLDLATINTPGAMSAADKTKLDSVNLTHIDNGQTAYGWGDHSTQGYLTSVPIEVETDPVFTASAAAGITSTNINNWNAAHSASHSAVTIGASANGLDLDGQELSLNLSSALSAGAMSVAQFNKLAAIDSNADNYGSWKLNDNSIGDAVNIESGDEVKFLGTGGATVTRTNKTITIDAPNAHDAVTIDTANGLSITDQVLSLATATTSLAGAMSATDKVNLASAVAGIHNAVTIGTANGLSLDNQQLSLAAATTNNAGAMSSTDKTKLNGIATNADNYGGWALKANVLGTSVTIGSGDTVTFLGSGDATVTLSDKTITIDVTSSSGIGGSGTSGWIPRFTPNGSTLGDSSIRDNGSSMAVGTTVSSSYKIYAYANNTNASIRGYNASTLSGSIGVVGEANGSGAGYLSRYDGTRRAAIYGVVGTGSGTKYAGYFSGDVYATGDVYSNSDIRLKKDIRSIEDPLGKIMKLNPVSFKWIADKKGRTNYGIIAQELDTVMPELVSKEDETLTVRYQEFTGVLIAAIQEQQKQIEHLKSEISELKDWRNV